MVGLLRATTWCGLRGGTSPSPAPLNVIAFSSSCSSRRASRVCTSSARMREMWCRATAASDVQKMRWPSRWCFHRFSSRLASATLS
eukprot:183740-Prymnesium_polylepis.1